MNRLKHLTDLRIYQWLFSTVHSHVLPVFFLSLISTIASLLSVVLAIVSKLFIDNTLDQSILPAILYGIFFAFLLSIEVVLNNLTMINRTRLRVILTNQLQKNLIKKYYQVEWQSVVKLQTGDFITRFTSDVTNIVEFWVWLVPNMFSLSFKLIGAFCILLIYDYKLALLALFLSPVSVFLSWLIGRKIKKHQKDILDANGKYYSYLNDSIHNLLIIKTFEYEQGSINKMQEYQNRLMNLVMKSTRFIALQNVFLGISSKFGFLLGLFWGAYRISTQSIGFGTFTAFLQLVEQVQSPIEFLSRSLPKIILAINSSERLMYIETMESEALLSSNKINPERIAGISVNNLSFHYSSSKTILHNSSFDIQPGDVVAFVGSSGAGKTTLFRLFLALLNPIEGSLSIVLYNGNVLPICSNTRDYFSYVSQGNSLFSGSIHDNLKLADPFATEEEMKEVLILANAWSFVSKMDSGLFTLIGEHGIGLSEGQAQRICIARAFLKKSPILLFDEATSALDCETELEVIHNIRKLNPPRTCIAITHRERIFEVCDEIYLFKNGTVSKFNNIV